MNRDRTITDPIEKRIYPLLVVQVYERSMIGIVATVVNASIIVLVLWGQIPSWKLMSWLTALLAVSLARVGVHRLFRQALERNEDLRPWGRGLLVGLGVSGLLWGASAVFLFPLHSVAHQVFIAFVLAGMVAGAVGVFSPILSVFLAFTVPALVPITVRFFLIGDALHLGMGAMTCLFGLLTFTTARRISAANRELIILKETFADQLEERTSELEATNRQLRHEIEERRQVEQALADSERRLADIIDFLPDPTWVIDSDGRVMAWNRAVEGITGIGKQAMIGKDNYVYALPFYGERRPMLIDLALERDARWEESYLSLREDNGMLIAGKSFHPSMGEGGRYYASTASRLFDAQGNVIGAIASIRDITADQQMEKEREHLIRDLQAAVAKVRTLSGLLPICSSCKKIRDDKGYWNQIESYILAHSDAEFSHGLCPECARKLYPDFYRSDSP